jgi:FolB domain-containing protein
LSTFHIRITDLEVFYRVGVPDEERAHPQRLLLTVDMEATAPRAAASDELKDTIDYFAVSQDLLKFGEGRSWKLLERLAVELAEFVLGKYQPGSVTVEVKKFIIPQARHIAVSCERRRTESAPWPRSLVSSDHYEESTGADSALKP